MTTAQVDLDYIFEQASVKEGVACGGKISERELYELQKLTEIK